MKIVNAVPYTIDNYIKCRGVQQERILDRVRLAFVRCPKCKRYMGIYQDELSATGQTKTKKCSCGFRNSLILKNW